jgi:hypothetical protein
LCSHETQLQKKKKRQNHAWINIEKQACLSANKLQGYYFLQDQLPFLLQRSTTLVGEAYFLSLFFTKLLHIFLTKHKRTGSR